MQVTTLIDTLYPSFTKSEKKLADFFNSDKAKDCLNMTLDELSCVSGVSESTIVRFFKKCDFKNYRMFMVTLYSEKNNSFTDQREAYNGKNKVLLNAIVEQENKCFEALKKEDYSIIAKELLEAEITFCVGTGYSGYIASLCAYRLSRSSFLSVPVIDNTVSHYPQALAPHTRAVAIVFSTSGETVKVINFMKTFKEKGVFIVLLTAHIHSTAAEFADVILCSPTNNTYVHNCEVNIDSMINQLLLIESIIIKCFDYKSKTQGKEEN